MDVLKFACTSCGSCCRRVGGALEAMQKLGFPYGVKEDGSCEQLTEDNKCKVYDNRPDACSVEKMYQMFHAPRLKKREEIFRLEAQICNSFMESDGLDKKYRIDLKQYN